MLPLVWKKEEAGHKLQTHGQDLICERQMQFMLLIDEIKRAIGVKLKKLYSGNMHTGLKYLDKKHGWIYEHKN